MQMGMESCIAKTVLAAGMGACWVYFLRQFTRVLRCLFSPAGGTSGQQVSEWEPLFH